MIEARLSRTRFASRPSLLFVLFITMHEPIVRRSLLATLATTVILAGLGSSSHANDWLTRPSRYTHDPASGYRVHQYAPDPVVVHTPDPTRSVYSQSRSTLQVGGSASYYHRVQQYGQPVQPYGQWRFPYRPFSVPYGQWGPQPMATPYWGWGGGFPGSGFPGSGFPGGGFPGAGFGAGAALGGPFGPWGVVNGSGMPWLDGGYNERRPKPFDGVPFGAP